MKDEDYLRFLAALLEDHPVQLLIDGSALRSAVSGVISDRQRLIGENNRLNEELAARETREAS